MVREKRKQFAHSQNVQKTDIGQAGAGTGANEWQHHCRCHEHHFVTWESQPALQCPSLYPAPLALYALCMYGLELSSKQGQVRLLTEQVCKTGGNAI